jgi:uncharacterized protein (DUF302 family)
MYWLYVGSAFFAGVVLTVAVIMLAMRNLMMEEENAEGSFEEVCRRLEKSIESTSGWGNPVESLDISEDLAQKGQELKNVRKMRNYFLCKAPYAARILDRFPFVSSMMPCSWGVYEKQDGQVYVARMNIPLMSKMFMGNIIGSTMGKVGQEEDEMIEKIKAA